MNKKILIPALALSIFGVAGALGLQNVYAQGAFGENNTMAQKLAQRFGLDQTEVETFMQDTHYQMHEERHAQMQADFESKLNTAVSEGKITSEQKDTILAEMSKRDDERDAYKDLDREERRAAMQANHDEFHAWLDQEGINLQDLGLGFGPKDGFEKGSRGGMFNSDNN